MYDVTFMSNLTTQRNNINVITSIYIRFLIIKRFNKLEKIKHFAV